MRKHGKMSSDFLLRNTRSTDGDEQTMKRQTVRGISTLVQDGLVSRSIAQLALKCLGVVVVGLAVTSCSATLAKWTSFGGRSSQAAPAATSALPFDTRNTACPQSPIRPAPEVLSATGSPVVSSVTSQKLVGSRLETPKCPQTINGPQPMPEWAVKFLQEMQARGLSR